MEPDFGRTKVAIVGLGLMGGSLAAALRKAEACSQVIGVARNANTVRMAQQLSFIHRGTTDLRAGVEDADVVVLATPVRDIITTLDQIGPWLKPGCLVLDVGSSKHAICAAMERLPAQVQPVGGHPMCGKESAGLTVAEPDLYQDRIFVLCPLARTAPEAVQLAQALVQAIGARPLFLEPERHDRLVAIISHLPYLLAVTLVNAADSLAQEDPLAWKLAAGGFRDTSRVAAGDVRMMLDILATNREPILATLHRAQAELARLTAYLEQGDLDELAAALEAARRCRTEVYS